MVTRKHFSNLTHPDQAAAELRAFFQARPSLTESEQLFIENRLRLLQMEYTLWDPDNLRMKQRTNIAERKDALNNGEAA